MAYQSSSCPSAPSTVNLASSSPPSAAGWDVVRVWEHESLEAAVTAVLAALARAGPVRTR